MTVGNAGREFMLPVNQFLEIYQKSCLNYFTEWTITSIENYDHLREGHPV